MQYEQQMLLHRLQMGHVLFKPRIYSLSSSGCWWSVGVPHRAVRKLFHAGSFWFFRPGLQMPYSKLCIGVSHPFLGMQTGTCLLKRRGILQRNILLRVSDRLGIVRTIGAASMWPRNKNKLPERFIKTSFR